MVSSIAMTLTIDKLPDDPTALKALLIDQQKKIQSQIDRLHESLRLERYRKYATSSEMCTQAMGNLVPI